MNVLRNQPKGARFASFGLGLCIFALMPTETGYQDIASLLARQPGVAERWQKRVFSSAGNIHVATFNFGRPIGTSSPQTATYAARKPRQSGHRHHGFGDAQPDRRAAAALSCRRFPQGRSHDEGRPPRRSRRPRLRRPQYPPAARRPSKILRPQTLPSKAKRPPPRRRELAPLDPELQAALRAPPLKEFDVSMSLESQTARRQAARQPPG